MRWVPSSRSQSWTKSVCYKSSFLSDGSTLIAVPLDDGSAIQSALAEMTGQSSVPNIFIAKKHIGGNSDLQAKKGNLKGLLADAGAL